MAMADYYLCDECGCKTFYDSNLSYDDDNRNPDTKHPWPDGNVGRMEVLCKDCAAAPDTHVAVRRMTEAEAREKAAQYLQADRLSAVVDAYISAMRHLGVIIKEDE